MCSIPYCILFHPILLHLMTTWVPCCQNTEGMHKCRKCWRKYVGFAPGRRAACSHGDDHKAQQAPVPQCPKQSLWCCFPTSRKVRDNSRLILIVCACMFIYIVYIYIHIYNYIHIYIYICRYNTGVSSDDSYSTEEFPLNGPFRLPV